MPRKSITKRVLSKTAINKLVPDMRAIIEAQAEFMQWKATVSSVNFKGISIDVKMDYVLSGIHSGLNPVTVIALCEVGRTELRAWLKIEANEIRFMKANAMAEALLESMVYNYARQDPLVAMSILEKRNPQRWQAMIKEEEIPSVEGDDPTIKRTMTITEIIKSKRNKLAALTGNVSVVQTNRDDRFGDDSPREK